MSFSSSVKYVLSELRPSLNRLTDVPTVCTDSGTGARPFYFVFSTNFQNRSSTRTTNFAATTIGLPTAAHRPYNVWSAVPIPIHPRNAVGARVSGGSQQRAHSCDHIRVRVPEPF